ncbi:hypothetical protein R2F61_08980 [Mollicutes bacterium LVI A0078]|nr:hypothetical protein RZE84_08755 [Mollicutes bacterium LVI A0075]WOO90834.1 hypothetical protein R2F61_08980 [Mollicutes bacterium LVI A0078]
MNIKLENLFETSIEKFKTNWKAITLNSIILGLIKFALAFALGFLGVFTIGLSAIMGTNGSAGLAVFFGIIFLLILIFLGLPVAFLEAVTAFIVADSTDGKRSSVFTSIKRVVTWSNIFSYIGRVILPLIGLGLVWILITGITLVISEFLGLFIFILLMFGFIFVAMLLSAIFLFSLYTDTNIKQGRKLLLAKYTVMEVFKAYLWQVLLLFVIGIVLAIFLLIPFLGPIVVPIVTLIFSTAITQAQMGLVSKALNGESIATGSQQEVTIQSDNTQVIINNFGAQITSVVKGGKEIMWQADPAFWGRTSPVLFPFVGKLKDDKYMAGGELIQMSQHGFLRDRFFTVIEKDDNSVIYEYTSTLADFNIYPCDFTVRIKYSVKGSNVTTEYTVINNNSFEMPYQIGAHPAFNVESVDGLEVEFPRQSVIKHYFEDGLQTTTENVDLDTVKLSYDLINDNIPCYSDFESKTMVLRENGREYLKFDFSSMEYLAIWSPEFKNAKFICIEPWNGICSKADQTDYLLTNKDGMQVLAPYSSATCGYSFEVC